MTGPLSRRVRLHSQTKAHGRAGYNRPVPTALARVSLDARLDEVEAHLIAWALDAAHGNKSRAADLLRIKRSTLGDRIKRLGLDRHRTDDP